MSISLTKPYLLDLHWSTEMVVVLRRYDEASHPWGVHVIDLYPPITSRPIGLFTDEAVLQLARKHNLTSYGTELGLQYSDDYNYDPVAELGRHYLTEYIWQQVVPMEWHGKRDELYHRVTALAVADPWLLAEWSDRDERLWQFEDFVQGRYNLKKSPSPA